MTKINQEEYEVLKELGDKWKWIARDESGSCFIFELKPIKDNRYELWEWVGNTIIDKIFDSSLFQFIQWEDSEPYNIQELIEEYEEEEYGYFNMKLSREFEQFSEESEETEVTKNIEWLKKWIYEYEDEIVGWLGDKHTDDYFSTRLHGVLSAIKEIREKLNQLDEPEALSLEKIDQAYKDGYEKGKEHATESHDEEEKNNLNRKVNQLIKAIENPKRIKLRDVIERMDALSEKNRNDWIERINERYEVETEQKYYVINNDQRMMLVRMMDGKTITEADPFKLEDMYEGEKESHRLTEKEIKDYDERYFAFAVKVEELEE